MAGPLFLLGRVGRENTGLGFRSLFAFWMGGAAFDQDDVAPPVDVVPDAAWFVSEKDARKLRKADRRRLSEEIERERKRREDVRRAFSPVATEPAQDEGTPFPEETPGRLPDGLLSALLPPEAPRLPMAAVAQVAATEAAMLAQARDEEEALVLLLMAA